MAVQLLHRSRHMGMTNRLDMVTDGAPGDLPALHCALARGRYV